MTPSEDVLARYRAHGTSLRAERDAAARTVNRLSNARLAAFAVIAVLAARWVSAAHWRTLWLLALLAVIVGFGWLVHASRQAKVRRQFLADLAQLADEGGARVTRAWMELPDRDWGPRDPQHAYAVDLDLFGRASLSSLFPPLSRAPGRPVLRNWLLAPAAPAQIAERQHAVRELRDDAEFREALAVAAMRMSVSETDLGALTVWAGSPGWVRGRTMLHALAVLVPVATVALIAAELAGWLQRPWWVVPVAAAAALTAQYASRLRQSIAPLTGQATMLRRYASAAALITSRKFSSPLLRDLQARLSAPLPAHRAIRQLTTLVDSSELRLSPLLYTIVQAAALWDFHVVRLLERWQARAGQHLGDWFAALGELEALGALATLAHDNPDWCFPDVDAAHATVEAEGIGHPLLAPAACVRNDVTVGPSGTVLVVTGSNMAGKSTLLRSIGLNLVLSQTGGPVCARTFRQPPAALYTSMIVQDSLARGVSFFMAELQRLKAVVDAAQHVGETSSGVFVYLLDEMLNGTNSAERTIAGRRVLRHLLDTGAMGAVSTHDLQLVDDPSFAAAAHHVHFSEQFGNGGGGSDAATMTFDYRLRPGKATSSNALKLLELVGLVGLNPVSR